MAVPEMLQTITAAYAPRPQRLAFWPFMHQRPVFTLSMIEPMIADPRINLGIEMIKGPILQNTRFFVDTDDPDIKEYVTKQLTRFWMTSAAVALEAIEWGFIGHEVLYRVEEGVLQFDTLKHLASLDVRPMHKDSRFVGMTVRTRTGDHPGDGKVFVGVPKAFWHIHNRQKNRWFGRSRLFGAYIPWWESWSDGGARDIRRLFFHKYAYDGGIMYHPEGTYKDQSGATRLNRDLALDIVEKKKSGGVMAMPNTMENENQRAWEYIPPQVFPTPDGVLQYQQELRDEIFEGIGIPPEVAQAEGTGAFAGRRVPQQAFYSTLQTLVVWLLGDLRDWILDPLLDINFGKNHSAYEIIPFGLIREGQGSEEEGEEQLPQSSQQPGQA